LVVCCDRVVLDDPVGALLEPLRPFVLDLETHRDAGLQAAELDLVVLAVGGRCLVNPKKSRLKHHVVKQQFEGLSDSG
jgi:hypothetical protein